MLNKLFESLDEKVFTTELKASLETSFNEAVELKSVELSEKIIEEKIEELQEKSEEFKAKLEEEAKQKQEELLESVDTYLERVVDDFLEESKESLDESLKAEKSDMIIEAFDAMITAGGVDVAKIVEAKESSEAENKLAESVKKYDELVEENIQLSKENSKLLKIGIIQETAEGLSLVEAEKFKKLADIVEFSNDESYLSKLHTIKESIQVKEKKDELNEDKAEDKQEKQAWSHLI